MPRIRTCFSPSPQGGTVRVVHRRAAPPPCPVWGSPLLAPRCGLTQNTSQAWIPAARPVRRPANGSAATCHAKSPAPSVSSAVRPSPTRSPVRSPPRRSPRRLPHSSATTPRRTPTRCAGLSSRSDTGDWRPGSWSPTCSHCAASPSNSGRGRSSTVSSSGRWRSMRCRCSSATCCSAGSSPKSPPTSSSTCARSSATSGSTDHWPVGGHLMRRSTMQSWRRLQLRKSLRAEAAEYGWRELIEEHGTPLLVLDPDPVVQQYQSLSTQLRGFRLHYAMKALPHPAVLAAVAACGGSFDVATTAEIDLLRSLGLPMGHCIHTHPVKKPADIDHAYRAGIRTFVVDNPVEAQKFAGRPGDIDVLVRLAFGNPSAKSDLSAKFGVDPAEAELLVKHVLAAGVRFAGFSFHVGSQGASAEPSRASLTGPMRHVGHIRETLGLRTRIIDIGGGFPVCYREPMPAIGSIADIVDDVLGERRHDFTLLAEPGRY